MVRSIASRLIMRLIVLRKKNQDFNHSPFGIVGSEYAFQLIYTAFVKKKGSLP